MATALKYSRWWLGGEGVIRDGSECRYLLSISSGGDALPVPFLKWIAEGRGPSRTLPAPYGSDVWLVA
jgi:hypothetical protein